MPIYSPGKRDPRHRNRAATAKRVISASLSLTSLVDVFTILVIFLLQNYSSTGEIIHIPKDVHLPKASEVKELKPAHIVTIGKDTINLDNEIVANLADVQAQKDWIIPRLNLRLQAVLEEDAKKQKTLMKSFKSAFPGPHPSPAPGGDDDYKKVTLQADKDLEFITIKKVMYTITEAGAPEISFAVMKKEVPVASPAP